VLLLTRAAACEYLSRITVAEVTATVRGIPQEVAVGRREGLDRPSVANLDNVYAIAKVRLGERIGHLAAGREREVKRALGYGLDWEELKVL
jgi:mRNA-degrading endonuclease toxin of MazEF toxin-antitoxin module